MKRLTLLSATVIPLICLSLTSKAQSGFKLYPDLQGSISDVEIQTDSARVFRRVDSTRFLPDSNKFIRKPQYNEYNQPATMPNGFKSLQSTAKPMAIHKIPVSNPESKKD